MTQLVTVTEYDFLKLTGAPNSLAGKVISQKAFDELTTLIEETPDTDDVDHGSIFWQRGKRLQVRYYVGVIQTSDGTQIEILPKIAKHDIDHPKLRNIVLKMLREVGDLPNKSGQNADLVTEQLPLLEIFIRDFLNEVQHLVKRGIRSDYLRQTDNLPFLKGKLLMANQLKYNLIRRDRFYVEYDSFEPDRPENRLIKSTLQKVLYFSKEYSNQRLARELLFAFGDIPFSTDYRQDFQCCSKDRGMHYYQDSLIWCRLILKNESPVPQIGERSFHSLLFPMPLLFERYVASILSRKLIGWKVRTQSTSKTLLSRAGEPTINLFQIRPDIILERNGQKIIVDTKWKLINQTDEKNKFGIYQSDLYQLFTYAKYYESNRVILLYPETERFLSTLRFTYNTDQSCALDLWPFKLDDTETGLTQFQTFLDNP